MAAITFFSRVLPQTTIGGTASNAGNLIASGGGNGISLAGTGTNIALLGNRVVSNTSLGIDLGTSGVTANDAGDADTGTNNLQNFPVLTSSDTLNGSTTITGRFNSNASTNYRIEFFSSATGDATGYGEGQVFLGFTNVTIDGSGNTPLSVVLSGVSVTAGHEVSATATVDLGSGSYGNSSEFSANVTATANTAPVLDNSKSPMLSAILEDAGAPSGAVGTLVSSLVDFSTPSGEVDMSRTPTQRPCWAWPSRRQTPATGPGGSLPTTAATGVRWGPLPTTTLGCSMLTAMLGCILRPRPTSTAH